jgi:hypothetical protein
MLNNYLVKIAVFSLFMVGMESPVFANLSDSLPFQWEFTPPNTGQPDRREGAATRGPCLAENNNLTALVPLSGTGLTTEAYPSFFWYLPKNTAQKLKFTIRNQEEIIIYALEYQLPVTLNPQIMSLTLPNFVDNQALKIGQEYHWRLELFCQLDDDIPITSLNSKITRVLPPQNWPENFKNTSLFNQVSIYAEAGIWYDTLSRLVELRNLYPNIPEFDAAWLKLLNSVNLEKIAEDSLKAEFNLH